MIAESKIEKMILNTGFGTEEIEKKLNVTRDQLLDENNWDGTRFTHPLTKALFVFKFNYDGDVFIEARLQ